MQKLKQTVILCGALNEVATLTIEKKLNGVFSTIKAYNLHNKDNLILGLNINNKIIKQNVSLNASNTYTFKLKDVDSIDSVECVIVSNNNGNFEPVLWCKNKDKYDKLLAEFNSVYVNSVNANVEYKTNDLNDNKAHLFEATNSEINDVIDKELESVDNEINFDANAEEIEDVFNEVNESENVEENIFYEENKKLSNLKDNEFFELISEQIDDLFDNYPRVDELEELIPSSKWVKIDFENNGNEYVLGLIYENFDLKYICYGVPGEFGSLPPKQLGKCQWLPLNPALPQNGYWVIYQDASTGDKVDII